MNITTAPSDPPAPGFTWDAAAYLRFASERGQACEDLIHRIALEAPARIADMGCGPGNSAAALRRRWPLAAITGVDNSPEMLAAARRQEPDVAWIQADVARWKTEAHFDLIFANAVLQWLPEQAAVCRHWFSQLASGGALAVQLPAHLHSPLHQDVLAVAQDPAWRELLAAPRERLTVESPVYYYDALAASARRFDLWETTYFHVMLGPDSVLEFFRGTGLRPFLAALPDDSSRQRFEAMLLERYRLAYPRRPDGKILLPFRRLFFVAYR